MIPVHDNILAVAAAWLNQQIDHPVFGYIASIFTIFW
jgi:hypothetical protein